jgi:hypothetical protein
MKWLSSRTLASAASRVFMGFLPDVTTGDPRIITGFQRGLAGPHSLSRFLLIHKPRKK